MIDSTSKMNRCKERKTNEDVVFGREREREVDDFHVKNILVLKEKRKES